MSGRDWRQGLRDAIPWVIFSVALVMLVVSLVGWAIGPGPGR